MWVISAPTPYASIVPVRARRQRGDRAASEGNRTVSEGIPSGETPSGGERGSITFEATAMAVD
jgi:hypothetical protein